MASLPEPPPTTKKRRRVYRCRLCSLPKKGHACAYGLTTPHNSLLPTYSSSRTAATSSSSSSGAGDGGSEHTSRLSALPPQSPPEKNAAVDKEGEGAQVEVKKKRKLEETEVQEPLGLDDLISRLPDGVLGEVVSRLPTKDGARTAVLASRWRRLWLSSPLNIDDDSGDVAHSDSDKPLVRRISKILRAHPGPGRRFCVSFLSVHILLAKLDRWFRSPALDNLQELEIHEGLGNINWYGPRGPLPLSALRFAPSLRVLAVGSCDFPADADASSLHFPLLKQLTIRDATISGDALHGVLSGSPALESLLLQECTGFYRVRITSRTLRSIGMYTRASESFGDYIVRGQELIIEDAPCLERLFPLSRIDGGGMYLNVRWISAPKLEILGSPISSWPTSLRTVKILALDTIHLGSVIDLLKCFPCVEKLYIKYGLVDGLKFTQHVDPLIPIECLHLHLKKIVLKGYRGKKEDLEFAKFFVLNAKVLELVMFRTHNYCTEKWMADQHRRLQLDNRASQGARFEFASDLCRTEFIDQKNHNKIHDLSIADPFGTSLCSCSKWQN